MDIIVVSDVFGITPALMALCEELNAVKIVDPYNGTTMNFKLESEAYSYFIEQVGLDAYLATLSKEIEQCSDVVTLIGFSVGASAIWRLSEKVSDNRVNHAVCFYGSQIRNYTNINPQFEIELVFPSSEPHFDVYELKVYLANKQNVTTRQVTGLHGFMNYHSSNYNPIVYQEQLNLLSLKNR